MTEPLELVDTHCHLHFADYDTDRKQVLASSVAAGVKRIICVGCSLDDSQKAINFAQDHSGVWATAGAHPHDGADFLGDEQASVKLAKMLAKPKVAAVGEIGLDYYRDITPKADQIKALRMQLEIGLQTNLPFVFHVREAWDDFWSIFDSYSDIRGVVHSFSAGPDRLEQALGRGLLVALNGLMTYTKDNSWLEAAKQVPLERLVLETDAPFLTPKPYRGRRCEPKHTADTCRFLAELRQQDPEQIARASTKNAVEFFSLGEERIK
ncbi:MAG: TatD family hydrolase [Candidatus Saccharimonadales bacterium]|jgi:TatD DNase family protein